MSMAVGLDIDVLTGLWPRTSASSMAVGLDMHVLTSLWPRTSAGEHGSWVR